MPALLRHHPVPVPVPVFGPGKEAITTITVPLGEGDTIRLPWLDVQLTVLDVPGHTSGHIAYGRDARPGPQDDGADGDPARAPWLFCGDTLFAGGCGRLFEGTPAQMAASLGKLAALPDASGVYCAHEYTLSNLRFAAAVEPDNVALRDRIAAEGAQRDAGKLAPGAAPLAAFAALREWKHHF